MPTFLTEDINDFWINLRHNNLDAVTFWLEAGMDPNILNNEGTTPIAFMLKTWRDNARNNNGNRELEILKLLLEHGVNPNDTVDNETFLSYAVKNKKIGAIEILLEYGANPNAITAQKRAIDYVDTHYGPSRVEVIEWLRNYGSAEPMIPITNGTLEKLQFVQGEAPDTHANKLRTTAIVDKMLRTYQLSDQQVDAELVNFRTILRDNYPELTNPEQRNQTVLQVFENLIVGRDFRFIDMNNLNIRKVIGNICHIINGDNEFTHKVVLKLTGVNSCILSQLIEVLGEVQDVIIDDNEGIRWGEKSITDFELMFDQIFECLLGGDIAAEELQTNKSDIIKWLQDMYARVEPQNREMSTNKVQGSLNKIFTEVAKGVREREGLVPSNDFISGLVPQIQKFIEIICTGNPEGHGFLNRWLELYNELTPKAFQLLVEKATTYNIQEMERFLKHNATSMFASNFDTLSRETIGAILTEKLYANTDISNSYVAKFLKILLDKFYIDDEVVAFIQANRIFEIEKTKDETLKMINKSIDTIDAYRLLELHNEEFNPELLKDNLLKAKAIIEGPLGRSDVTLLNLQSIKALITDNLNQVQTKEDIVENNLFINTFNILISAIMLKAEMLLVDNSLSSAEDNQVHVLLANLGKILELAETNRDNNKDCTKMNLQSLYNLNEILIASIAKKDIPINSENTMKVVILEGNNLATICQSYSKTLGLGQENDVNRIKLIVDNIYNIIYNAQNNMHNQYAILNIQSIINPLVKELQWVRKALLDADVGSEYNAFNNKLCMFSTVFTPRYDFNTIEGSDTLLGVYDDFGYIIDGVIG